jgi:PPOX class probable FMN-dependent enzyme
MDITNEEQLRALYGLPSGRAKVKVLSALDVHAKNFIEQSPFLTIATTSQAGQMDVSPRGGVKGFVHIVDDYTIIIPDAKGNNRLDSLTNIIETKGIGMLFFLPGVDETLRINGNAVLSTNPLYLEQYKGDLNPPKTCIVVSINEVFLHCAKAFMRSKLWDVDAQIKRSEFPTMGQMLKDQINSTEEPETMENMVKRYQKDL